MKDIYLALYSLIIPLVLLTTACAGAVAPTGTTATDDLAAATTATMAATAPATELSTPTSAPSTEQVSADTPEAATVEPSTPLTELTVITPNTTLETMEAGMEQIVGTVVRFSAGTTSVDVTIGEDNPAVRDFLSMLPLTLQLEEFAGREKIAYLPRELEYAGSPGSDPEDGDLIYYTPWGNLGFYYNTAGVGYSDQTLHFGTYNASREQLEQLETQDVTVEIVR